MCCYIGALSFNVTFVFLQVCHTVWDYQKKKKKKSRHISMLAWISLRKNEFGSQTSFKELII